MSGSRAMGMKIATMLLALPLAATVDGAPFPPQRRKNKDLPAAVLPADCIPCDVLFSELISTESGGHVQEVQMQLRGEPKSGTGMVHQWASGLLHHACDFLRRSFGENTCSMSWESEDPDYMHRAPTNRSLSFDPRLAAADAPCPCHNVDRVLITVSKHQKHTLPVDPSCSWWRPNQIVGPRSNYDGGCTTFKGSVASNYSDLIGCMQEAACQITDNRKQLVILRDPRAVAVSSFYHRKNGGVIPPDTTLEEYVPKILAGICKWTSVRYVLFSGVLQEKSTIFWYGESVARPLAWHRTFSDSVGLHLPASVVEGALDAALRGDFDFNTKTMDQHDEPSKEEVVLGRTWRDEVGLNQDFIAELDAVLRVWLPPVLLAKWGLALAV